MSVPILHPIKAGPGWLYVLGITPRRELLLRKSTCHGPRPGPKLAPLCPGGFPVCHGGESTRKDPRPEEKKCRSAKKTHLYILIVILIRTGSNFPGVLLPMAGYRTICIPQDAPLFTTPIVHGADGIHPINIDMIQILWSQTERQKTKK